MFDKRNVKAHGQSDTAMNTNNNPEMTVPIGADVHPLIWALPVKPQHCRLSALRIAFPFSCRPLCLQAGKPTEKARGTRASPHCSAEIAQCP